MFISQHSPLINKITSYFMLIWKINFNIIELIILPASGGGIISPTTKNNRTYYIWWLIDWLISHILFRVVLEIISFLCGRHRCRWMTSKHWPLICTYGLWARRILSMPYIAVTRGLGFQGIIRRTTPFCRHVRILRIYSNPICTGIL